MTPDMHRQAASAQPAQWTAIALRGAGQMFDRQMSTMRTMLQTQARTVAAFGWPDCSDLFDGQGADQQVRQAISTGTERLLSTTQRANETLADVQRQLGRLVQQQTASAAQNWQQGLEQLGAQTDESLSQLRETALQQTEQLQRNSEALTEPVKSTGDDKPRRERAG